ncbi:UDP-N-acetylmuramate:L-alanyl-gamma-D-glutamyl-meso-diaminopimelate ligase [Solemya pervernicosa gill symbiont]|uniref:UDP-N-acetylmuramate--L-alanyl-gamma-D-glutamyl-meso-2,6-diaminoheptandioate ligase n=2 Tax=Gammaproteobacteria incertae sedis TaxID=118884 RepID=A0A1T2L139_9GAMM|nr:UDP-N-acetylmuramate:L-alanyl-gamma-D-glutamyl-meso-diaminopimelate ligase [Candidatus Reidiella endopervernicosa]OOZ38656.1 UDP-N-acetylmuramate:L-alanyl-gamma-D-glutamyl-meso-diaminopimelate ligase [Solemya pervernicosa gill symbiont]QKQ26025.1 UDP-N-acetylmuramate:L-alanyl-gamma-D-glutamyl-meso-diaminopimelate ligase [Candidatus Reidiella endopervernicosa]
MHIHILGICGAFMGGVALLAREAGYSVSGSDANVYPPMSTQLEEQGIVLHEGYDSEPLDPAPDLIVVGNAMSRGNPAVEYMLDRGLPYISGPAFLADYVLRDHWVLAVAGTHGKTTTSSMLAAILDYAKLEPGFLIGGVPGNFGLSARLGNKPFFVVEADEYDTAFFDKRSKFVHYRPRTLILNNLEYDHADIFPDLDAIKRQFHHLLRTVPGNGLVLSNSAEPHLDEVLEMGCWTPQESFALQSETGWGTADIAPDGSSFDVTLDGERVGRIEWSQSGLHNVANALAAIGAARHAGVPVEHAIEGLNQFAGVKRRMELRAKINDIAIYDDFAHHPTAISTTLEGVRGRIGEGRIFAVLEPRSNTMRMGVHREALADSLKEADRIFIFHPQDLDWPLAEAMSSLGDRVEISDEVDTLVDWVAAAAMPDDQIIVMSNGGFGDIHERLAVALAEAGEVQ